MPGAKPSAAVDAFVDPLKIAIGCIGQAHISLSQRARNKVGETHSWTLNDGVEPMRLSNGFTLRASMRFETLDRGQSAGRGRYRVTTREYIYEAGRNGREIISAHWHPSARNSPYPDPHYHFGGIVLADDGVYLERAHIRSPRVSLEEFVRLMIVDLGVKPTCDDWAEKLARTEQAFEEHSSW